MCKQVIWLIKKKIRTHLGNEIVVTHKPASLRLKMTFLTGFKYLLKHKLLGEKTIKGTCYNCVNIFFLVEARSWAKSWWGWHLG